MIRILIAFLMAALSPLEAHAQAKAPPAEISALLGEYRAAWGAHAFATLDHFWDTTDPNPVYLAEEAGEAALDWPALRAYWKETGNAIERIEVAYSDIRVQPTAQATEAVIVMDMRWDAKWDGGRFTGGDNRVIARVRQTAAGWRFVSWVEAPLAPIVYLRRMYQNSVSPEMRARLSAPQR